MFLPQVHQNNIVRVDNYNGDTVHFESLMASSPSYSQKTS